MMEAFRKFVLPAMMLMALILGPGPTGAAVQEETVAWNFLVGNLYENSENVFSEILGRDSGNQNARRGLIVSLVCQGRDDQLEAQLREYAKHPSGTPFDYFLPEFVRRNTELATGSFYETLFDYADKISRNPALPAMDVRNFRDLALEYAYLIGSVDKVEEIRGSLGRITEWAVIGPFDNTSGAGQRRDYLDSLDPDQRQYPGKQGQMISWFFPHWIGLDGTLTPANHFYLKENTTAYLRTTLTVPGGQYLLSLGYQGDAELLVDGYPIHEGMRLRWNGVARQWLITLSAGRHEVGVKISNGGEPSRVACSLVNRDGSLISGMEVNPRASMAGLSREEPRLEVVENSLFYSLDGSSGPDVSDQELAFWLPERMAWDLDPGDLELSEELLQANENSALLYLEVARLLAAIGSRSEAKVLLDEAFDLAATLVPAALELASRYMEDLRFDKAKDLAEGVLGAAPDCRMAIRIKLACLGAENQIGAQADYAAEISERLPKDPLGYHFQAEAAASLGDLKSAGKFRAKEIKLLPPGSRRVAQVVGTLEDEDFAEARDRLKELIELVPDQEVFWEAYIRSLIAITHYDEALVVLQRTMDTFPQDLDLIIMKSQFFEAGFSRKGIDRRSFFPKDGILLNEREFQKLFPGGRYIPGKRIVMKDPDLQNRYYRICLDEEAAEILDEALVLEPGNFWIRNRIRKLRGQTDLRTYLEEVDVDEFLANRPPSPPGSGYNAVILRDWRRRFVFDNQASLQDRFLAVEVMNQTGIGAWENHTVPYSPYLEDLSKVTAFSVKKDGRRVDADIAGSKIVFRQLEPGDILVLSYQLLAHHLGSLAGQFWDHHVFNYEYPCLDSRFKLILPNGVTPRFRVRNDPNGSLVASSRAKIDADYQVMEWSSRSLSPVGWEPFSPNARFSYPWVDVSTIESWETVSQWYADLARGQSEPTPRVAAVAEEITAGCATPEAVIETIYEFVANKITYEYVPLLQSALVPRSAEEVLVSRYGDCKDKSTLMVAMLQAEGITDCSIGLTSAWGDSSSQFLPSPRFNHAIVGRRTAAGVETWYDPTLIGGVAGQVPASLVDVPCLPAGPVPSGLTLVGSTPGGIPERDSRYEMILEPNGDALIKGTTVYRSTDDLSEMRHLFNSFSTEEVERVFLMGIAKKYPGARLESFSGGEEGGRPGEFLVEAELVIPGCFSVSGDILAGTIPAGDDLAETLGQIVALQERSRPLDQRPLATRRHTVISVTLPDGFELLSLPQGQQTDVEGFQYLSNYRSEDPGLVMDRVIRIESKIVAPENYPEMKSAMDAAMRDMGMTFVLKSGG